MRLFANEPNRRLAVTVSPLIGVVGTVAGMLFAFKQIGTEPEWKTALQAVGFSLAVTAAILIVLGLALRSRR